jgi:hypothetical protein
MYPTPRASGQENPESLIKRKGLREAMQHNLTAAVQLMYPTPTKGMHKQDVNDNGEYARRIKSKGNQIMLPAHVKLYPTPRVSDTEGGVVKNVELNNGSFSRKNKQGTRWGVKLKDAVNYLEENEMYPTPTQDSASERTKKYKQGGTPLVMAVKKNAKVTGARLSPSFVEFLMGFPPQWTETEHQD